MRSTKSAVLFAQNSTELGENIRAFGNCLDKNPESDLFDCHFGWFLTSFMLIGTSMLLQGPGREQIWEVPYYKTESL